LSGSHRVGKSTLAKAFSEKTGVPFVQTGASQVFQEMGLDPKVDYPLEVRLGIQKKILESFEKQCKPYSNKSFVTDRTPIDFMAYTLADCQRGNISDELSEKIGLYMEDCVNLTNWLFPVLIVVQPGIPLVEEKDKAPANIAYVEHINHLIMGLVVSEAIQSEHFYIPRHVIDLRERIDCMEYGLSRANQKFDVFKKSMAQSGEAIIFH